MYRLPGNYGCLIFNKAVHATCVSTGTEVSLPTQKEVGRIFEEIRFLGTNTHKGNVGQSRFGKLVAWFSRKLNFPARSTRAEAHSENRVAVSAPIIRAYISSPKIWKNCTYDCKECSCTSDPTVIENHGSQGHIAPIDLSKSPKEFFDYAVSTPI